MKRHYLYTVWLINGGRRCACRLFVRKDAALRCLRRFRESHPDSYIEINI